MRIALPLTACLSFVAVLSAAGFAPAVGIPGTTAVPLNAPHILAWASSVSTITYGDEVDEEWRTPERALGRATRDVMDIVSLGEGGRITLGFAAPIGDQPGADIAVYENALSDAFLELAFVEVSSDGVHFVRFPNASLTANPVPRFGIVDATRIDGLAGKYRVGYGTPFDLADLRGQPGSEKLDFQAITQVRLIDVKGDGSAQDSTGRVIYDPHPTIGSAGFDLDAVAVLAPGPLAGQWSPTRPFSWLHAPGVGWGWFYQLRLGYLYWEGGPWFYTPRHGWLYHDGGAYAAGCWFLSPTQGALWAVESNGGWLWQAQGGAWLQP